MNLNKIATKSKALFFTSGPSVDASYGPWDNIEQYESFLHDDLGLESPYEYTKIMIRDSDNGDGTEYIYKNSQWQIYIDMSDAMSRIEALEGDKNASIASKISGTVSLSKSKLYAGQTVVINITGKVNLPSEISSQTNKISSIQLNGSGQSVSGQPGTSSVSLSNISISNTTTFSLSAHVDAPYTKNVSASATITKYCPVYIGVVDGSVTNANQAVAAIAKDSYLQSPNDPLTTIIGLKKTFTYNTGQRLAFICAQSNVIVQEDGALAEDAYEFKGTTTIQGMNAYVYITSAQSAVTRSMNFKAQ